VRGEEGREGGGENVPGGMIRLEMKFRGCEVAGAPCNGHKYVCVV